MDKFHCDYCTAYLQHDDYNVILVDWEPLAASTFYLGPMQNTVRVGKDAANFIDFLVTQTDLTAEDVHFLGISYANLKAKVNHK